MSGGIDPVAVVAGSFDRPWAGALAAGGDEQGGDVGQVGRQGVGPVLRGECRPSRWRCGGSGAGPWRSIHAILNHGADLSHHVVVSPTGLQFVQLRDEIGTS
jgi:hypothetical protein